MDCINIYDLLVFANHGVLKEENVLGQKFVVSVSLYVDTREASKDDDVDKTVNYAEVCKLITNHLQSNTYKLIETAANETAKAILTAFPKIYELELEIKKPWAPVHLAIDSVSVKIRRKRNVAYIGFGSNMGDRKKYLQDAIKLINDDELSYVDKVSSFIETKPYGYTDQDDFLNGAAKVYTLRDAHSFLELLSDIENKLGRVRQIHWGPRTVDLDILLFNDEIINSKNLIVPHIEMHKRDFVLKPMMEIAPEAVHPVLNSTVSALYYKLNEA